MQDVSTRRRLLISELYLNMKTTPIINFAPENPFATTMPAVVVLALYEDLAAGLRAKYWLDRLSRHMGVSAAVTRNLCRLDFVSPDLPLPGEHAEIENTPADALLFSVKWDEGRTDDLREWMDLWLGHRENRAFALGVLLGPQLAGWAERDPVISNVRRYADYAGVIFFAAHRGPPPTKKKLAILAPDKHLDDCLEALDDCLVAESQGFGLSRQLRPASRGGGSCRS